MNELIDDCCCLGTILMVQLGNSLRVGTSRCRFRSGGRVSASCIRWRILRFPTHWRLWNRFNMDLGLLVLGLRFLVLMITTFANTLHNQTTSGGVSIFFTFDVNCKMPDHVLWIWTCKCIGRHELVLGNTFVAKPNSKPPNKEVPPQVCILTVELLIAVTFRILWNFSVDFFLFLRWLVVQFQFLWCMFVEF